MPAQVHETKIVYQQPVEIESVQIEKIIPKVVEEVTVEKEHVHQKVRPEIYVENATYINEGHQYYSQNNKDRIENEKERERERSEDTTTTTTSITTNKEKDVPQNVEHVVL